MGLLLVCCFCFFALPSPPCPRNCRQDEGRASKTEARPCAGSLKCNGGNRCAAAFDAGNCGSTYAMQIAILSLLGALECARSRNECRTGRNMEAGKVTGDSSENPTVFYDGWLSRNLAAPRPDLFAFFESSLKPPKQEKLFVESNSTALHLTRYGSVALYNP